MPQRRRSAEACLSQYSSTDPAASHGAPVDVHHHGQTCGTGIGRAHLDGPDPAHLFAPTWTDRSGKLTAVSCSETSHGRRAASVSYALSERPTSVGPPRPSMNLLGPA